MLIYMRAYISIISYSEILYNINMNNLLTICEQNMNKPKKSKKTLHFSIENSRKEKPTKENPQKSPAAK